jgi:hypothetical protein
LTTITLFSIVAIIMSEFESFNEGAPDAVDYLGKALNALDPSGQAVLQLEASKAARATGLPADADDIDQRDQYVLTSPRYEAAARNEHTALMVAAGALAKFYQARAATESVRATLENEATAMIGEANKVSNKEVTAQDFLPDDQA